MATRRNTKYRPTFIVLCWAISCVLMGIEIHRHHGKMYSDQEEAVRNNNQRESSTTLGNLFQSDQELSKESYPILTEDDEVPKSEPIIYSRLRKDQAGWVILDMLKAHSYAFSNNVTYGGACGESTHKEDIEQVLASIGWREILPLRCPNKDDDMNNTRVYPSSLFERDHERRMASIEWRGFIKNHTDYSYFDELNRYRKDKLLTPRSIVVHIRRRDVTPCCYPQWYLPNSYFVSMIHQYVEESKNYHHRPVDVQIFSQSDSHESWRDFETMMHLQGHNFTLNLDGPIGNVWRAIVSADVFIGSISEFSRVPAMFAKGYVPNPRNITNLHIATQTRDKNRQLLEECGEMKVIQCKHKWWLKSGGK